MSETTSPPAQTPTAPTRRNTTMITKVKSLQELFAHPELKTSMAKLAPTHLNTDRLLKTFTSAVLKTPGLAKASPLSMLGAAMTIAYLGLEPNSPLGLMYLIPFDVTVFNRATKQRDYVRTDVTPIVGYEGYLELINRGRMVKDIDCQLIWPGDVFENERGSNRHFKHVQNFVPHPPDMEPTFAYMFARTVTGGEYLELIPAADVRKIRNMSQGYRTAVAARDNAIKNGWTPARVYTEAPWVKHADAMWRKTPLRQGQKWLPGRTPEMALAAHLDEMGEAGRVRFDNVLDVEQVIEGSWEVAESDVEPQDDGEPTEATKTQVQSATVGPQPDQKKEASGQPEQKPAAERQSTRKAAPAKAAAQPAKPADDEPPDDGRWGPSDGQPVQGQQSAPVDHGGGTVGTSPADEATNPSAGVPPFDALLLDENGTLVSGDPAEDPMTYVRQLAEYLGSHEQFRDRILQENADGTDAVRNHPSKEANDALDEVLDPPKQEEVPGAIVIELKTERGKPLEQPYQVAFNAEVATLVPENFFDFIDLNKATMLKVRGSFRSLMVKGLEARAKKIGVVITSEMRTELMAPPTAPGAKTPQDVEAEDLSTVRNRIADINQAKDLRDLEAFNEGPVLKSFADRMTRENKPQFVNMVKDAYLRRKKELSGAPA
jgi:recombination protein RecT